MAEAKFSIGLSDAEYDGSGCLKLQRGSQAKSLRAEMSSLVQSWDHPCTAELAPDAKALNA